MSQLSALIKELEQRIPDLEKEAPKVSASAVGWHIEHSLLTINAIIAAMGKSDPKDYQWKFSFPRLLVFTINKIPRGRAKAPVHVQPKTVFTSATLKEHVDRTVEKLNDLNGLQAKQFLIHPYFGKLNVKQTIKFLGIHTRHHIAIINDIIKQA